MWHLRKDSTFVRPARVFCILFFGIIVLTSSTGRTPAQSWTEKARESIEDLRRKAKVAEHPCADCGKAIKVGKLCAACAAKRAKEKLSEASQAAGEATSAVADRAAAGLGRTIAAGVNAYNEARKPEWQRLIESDFGIPSIAGGVIFLCLLGLILARNRAPK